MIRYYVYEGVVTFASQLCLFLKNYATIKNTTLKISYSSYSSLFHCQQQKSAINETTNKVQNDASLNVDFNNIFICTKRVLYDVVQTEIDPSS